MHNSSPHADFVKFVNSNDIHAQISALLKIFSARLTALFDSFQIKAQIEHIGSTAIPDSLTKGDLDILCLVNDADFESAKSGLTQHFVCNEGTDGLALFASFECHDYAISVGVQLKGRSSKHPPFLAWRDLLLHDSEVKQEYDQLKCTYDGQKMSDYRLAKERIICKYLPDEDSNENEIFAHIKDRITSHRKFNLQPIRVAINGIEGTGKTLFAKKLTYYLHRNMLEAVHVSIDGFHFNQAHRYRQGRDSARGYYEDSYDELSFVKKVLLSSQSDHPHYTPATHDLDTDKYLELTPIPLNSNSILITDGAYLYKPNYLPHWDIKIYLKVEPAIALKRGIARDLKRFGSQKEAENKFRQRYHAASALYNHDCSPLDSADIIIDLSDFNHLKIL